MKEVILCPYCESSSSYWSNGHNVFKCLDCNKDFASPDAAYWISNKGIREYQVEKTDRVKFL